MEIDMSKIHDGAFGEIIHTYSRAQALEDGLLIDVTEVAKEAGFRIQTAVTNSVWCDYIQWDNVENDIATQNTEGRLWDVLSMLRLTCRHFKNESEIRFCLHVIPRDQQTAEPSLITLKADISYYENGEPAITIMLPSEY